MKTTKTNMWKEAAEAKKNRMFGRLFYDLTKFEEIRKVECDGIEYTIFKNAEYVNETGGIGAIALKLTNGREAKFAILTDEYFQSFPEHVQNFIIHHEIGHITDPEFVNMTHEDSVKMNHAREHRDLPNIEYTADKFAAEHLGYIIATSALEYLRDETNCPLPVKNEFNKRIRRLDMEERLEGMTEEQRERNRKRVERCKKATAIVMSPGFIIGLSLAAVGVIGLGIRHKQFKPAMKKFGEKSKSIWNKYYR